MCEERTHWSFCHLHLLSPSQRLLREVLHGNDVSNRETEKKAMTSIRAENDRQADRNEGARQGHRCAERDVN